MSSATDIVEARSRLRRERFRTTDGPEIATLSGGDIDVVQMIIDAVGGPSPAFDIASAVISGEVFLSMDGAPQVEVTVHDQARTLIRSGVFWSSKGRLRAVDVYLDGLWWRLARISKQQDDLVLYFEDRNVSRLREKFGPRKLGSRAKITRAQAVQILVRSVKESHIECVIPELTEKQPLVKKTLDSRAVDSRAGGGGFGDTKKLAGLGQGQLDNVAVFLKKCEELGVSERVMLVGLVAGYGESGWRRNAKDGKTGTHQGVFQSNQIPASDLEAQSYYFLKGGRSFREGGAIRATKAHPTWTVGMIASYVEISDAPGSHYDRYFSQARKLLDEWTGGSGSADASYTKQYAYRVDKLESYWEAIQRLADEVRWRAFFSGGKFYYLSEDRLFNTRSVYTIEEGENGVTNIDFDDDARKRIQDMRVSARIDRWAAPPGTVITVKGLGSSGSQRWLVESVRRQLFSPDAEIVLKRVTHKKGEPRSEEATKSKSISDTGTGTIAGKIEPGMTAQNVINRVFLPIGRRHGLKASNGGPLTYVNVVKANRAHSHLGSSSDHAGPPAEKWAVDMGNGLLTKQEYSCAKEICDLLGIEYDGKSAVLKSVTKFGFRFQVIFGFNFPEPTGDHRDHIHIGVKRAS